MARYRSYSIEFKRQVVREYLAGEVSLHGLAKRHRICRHLIRLWLTKYEAGSSPRRPPMAESLEEYEARIAALERKVGQLTMENDLLKKTLPISRSPNGASASIVSGPPVSPDARMPADGPRTQHELLPTRGSTSRRRGSVAARIEAICERYAPMATGG